MWWNMIVWEHRKVMKYVVENETQRRVAARPALLMNVILVNVYILVYAGRDLMTIDTCGSWGEKHRYTRPRKALCTEVGMTSFWTCVLSTRTHLCPHRHDAAGQVWPVWRAHHQVGIVHHLHHQNACSVPLLLVKSGHMYVWMCLPTVCYTRHISERTICRAAINNNFLI